MLAETHIFLQLIEQEKLVRPVSIHAHSVPGERGDGPGIFVDPRGEFDEHTDQAFTRKGKEDDILAFDMLAVATKRIGAKLLLKDDQKKKTLSPPFHGNLATPTKFQQVPLQLFTAPRPSIRQERRLECGLWCRSNRGFESGLRQLQSRSLAMARKRASNR
jgi:hypothetical protein